MPYVGVVPSYAMTTLRVAGLDTNGVEFERSMGVEFALVGATIGDRVTTLKTNIDAYVDLYEAASKAKVTNVTVSFILEPSAYATPVASELYQEALISVRLEGLGQKLGTIVIPSPANLIVDGQGNVDASQALVLALAGAYKPTGEAGSTNAVLSDRETMRPTNFIEGGKLRYRSRKAR